MTNYLEVTYKLLGARHVYVFNKEVHVRFCTQLIRWCKNKKIEDFRFLSFIFSLVRGVNQPKQVEHFSIQTYLIILMNLKFCSNLICLFLEPNLNKLLLS